MRYFMIFSLALGSTMLVAQQPAGEKQRGNQTTHSESTSSSTHNQSTTQSNKSGAGGGANLSAGDRTFIMKVAKEGQQEVSTAQMAADKATDSQVKSFAQKLVSDHTQANQELMQLAQQKGVNVGMGMESHHRDSSSQQSSTSTSSSKTGNTETSRSDQTTSSTSSSSHAGMSGDSKMMGRYAKMQGADFDRAFVRDQVSHHEKDIKEFEKQSRTAQDSDLRAFIDKTLPTLRQHLETARSLQQTTGRGSNVSDSGQSGRSGTTRGDDNNTTRK